MNGCTYLREGNGAFTLISRQYNTLNNLYIISNYDTRCHQYPLHCISWSSSLFCDYNCNSCMESPAHLYIELYISETVNVYTFSGIYRTITLPVLRISPKCGLIRVVVLLLYVVLFIGLSIIHKYLSKTEFLPKR